MKAIRTRVRAVIGGRHRVYWSLADVIRVLNPILRGWGTYFAVGNASRHFTQVDMYTTEQVCLFLSRKHGKSGRGWATRWAHVDLRAEGLHQLSGTVRWYSRRAHAPGCRTSESRMRENLTYGSMRGSRGGPLGVCGPVVSRRPKLPT